MRFPEKLRKTWGEWTSPRYSRIKLKLDPLTQQITAETEVDPPTTRHDQFRLIVYTSVIILAVIIVTILFFRHTERFWQKAEESEVRYDELYKQNAKQLDESLKKLEAQQEELAKTRQELGTIRNLNRDQIQNNKKQVANLEKKIMELQEENEALLKKIQDISSGKKGPAPRPLPNVEQGPAEAPISSETIPNPERVLPDTHSSPAEPKSEKK